MTCICVDLSHYQKGFSFPTFKASGGLGVILKATEGQTIRDASYSTFRTQALAAGLKVATYHFLRPGDPAVQAAFYLTTAKPAVGERVVCDWEDDSTTAANVVLFMQQIVKIRPDLELTIYSGATAKEKLTEKNDWLAANTSLWLAQYTSASPSWPKATWPQWSLWQFSDRGVVPGLAAPVDQNRFNGPDENFLAWMGPAPLSPQLTAAPVITISSSVPIKIKLGANVEISL